MNKVIISLFSLVLLVGCSVFSPKTSTEELARGEMYYKTGEFKKSLDALNKAVKKDPYNVEAYASRGTLLFELEEYDKAIADFEIVKAGNPDRSEAYSAIGAALAAKGDYPAAIESLKKALELNPGNVEAMSSLGGIYYSTGEFQKAVEEYTNALKYRKASQLYFTRGLAYDKLGKLKEAKADFEAAGYEVAELPAETVSVSTTNPEAVKAKPAPAKK